MTERVHADDHPGEGLDEVADQLLRPAGDLAVAGEALVGANLHQHDLIALHSFMGGPARLVIAHRQRIGADPSNLHDVPPHRALRDSGYTAWGAAAIAGRRAATRLGRCYVVSTAY